MHNDCTTIAPCQRIGVAPVGAAADGRGAGPYGVVGHPAGSTECRNSGWSGGELPCGPLAGPREGPDRNRHLTSHFPDAPAGLPRSRGITSTNARRKSGLGTHPAPVAFDRDVHDPAIGIRRYAVRPRRPSHNPAARRDFLIPRSLGAIPRPAGRPGRRSAPAPRAPPPRSGRPASTPPRPRGVGGPSRDRRGRAGARAHPR